MLVIRSRHLLRTSFVLLISVVLLSFQLPIARRAVRAAVSDESSTAGFEPLPNFDIRWFERGGGLPATAERKGVSLASKTPASAGLALKWNDELDLPHHLFSTSGPLTSRSTDDAEVVAKKFVTDNSALFAISRSELDEARVSARSVDDRAGFTRLALEQRVSGIRVFDSDMLFIIDREGRVVSESGSFVPALRRRALDRTPKLTPDEALDRAAAACETELTATITSREDNIPARERILFSSDEIDERTEASLVYYPITQDDVRLAYQILLYGAQNRMDAYLVLVDARTGDLLRRDSLTFALDPPAGRVFTDKDPMVTGSRAMVALSGDQTASPQGWVKDNRTAGNNTEVYVNTNLSGGSTVQGDGQGNFDFPIDLAPGHSPIPSANASATNLFYWVNLAHDRFYALGFNEASRNSQADNFNRGGRGGDPVRADTLRGAALDPSQTNQLVRNNAYFQAALEGSRPLLAMLMWNVNVNGQVIEVDSSYDAGVIIHEYTHGVSLRLSGTDNSLGLRSTQGGGMGEGWSDFFAHSFLFDGLPVDGAYPAGVYLTRRDRGIRTYPYSTTFTSDPLTFGDIQYNSEAHAVGTVWCSMLWDMRQAFVERYGLAAGRSAAERLVINGLKLLPLAPTVIDARDAILLADRTTNGGANQGLIWRAFARRGLGRSAQASLVAPSVGFRIAAVEGYDVPAEVTAGSIVINDRPPAPAVQFEALPVVVADRDLAAASSVTVSVRNLRSGEAAALVLVSTEPGRFESSFKVAPPGVYPGPGLTIGAQPGDEIAITYENARNEQGATETLEARTVAGRRVTVYSYGFEQGEQGWTLTSYWHMTERRALNSAHSLYFAKQKGENERRSFTKPASGGPAYSPLMNLDGLIKPQLEFDYYFSGAITGTQASPAGDILTLAARNFPYTSSGSPVGGEPPLSLNFDIRPQSDAQFRHEVVNLRFIGNRSAYFNFNFVASQADIARKKLEGFYLDNISVTAVSTR